MKHIAGILLLLAIALPASLGQSKPVKIPQFRAPTPPSTRFQPEVNLSGKNLKNFGGTVGGRIEHDFVRKGPHTVTGVGSASRSFDRTNGHTRTSPTNYGAGLRYRFSFRRR